MTPRILVIRGGAIGDFVLTLPAIRLLREAFPQCELVLLGYRHILELACDRWYATEARSIEYGPLSRFFIPNAPLDEALHGFFAEFQQVVSYLYDPDGFFRANLERCGVKRLLVGNPRISDRKHAVEQLAEPLEQLALYLEDPAPRLYPNEADTARANQLLRAVPRPFLALHPGSGSLAKNWPTAWFCDWLPTWCRRHPDSGLVLVGGEADQAPLTALRNRLGGRIQATLHNIPLPVLAAVFRQARLYLGHDTGISHIAAAAGARCVLLFGPTDPEIWGPRNPGVTILRAATSVPDALPALADLSPKRVDRACEVVWELGK